MSLPFSCNIQKYFQETKKKKNNYTMLQCRQIFVSQVICQTQPSFTWHVPCTDICTGTWVSRSLVGLYK